MAAECSREPGAADPLRVEWAMDGLALRSRPQLRAVEQREMHARIRGRGRPGQGITLPGRLAVREAPDRDTVDELHGLELGAAEDRDVGRPLDAPVERSRHQRVVVARARSARASAARTRRCRRGTGRCRRLRARVRRGRRRSVTAAQSCSTARRPAAVSASRRPWRRRRASSPWQPMAANTRSRWRSERWRRRMVIRCCRGVNRDRGERQFAAQ